MLIPPETESTSRYRISQRGGLAWVAVLRQRTRRLRREMAGGGVSSLVLLGLFGRSIVPGTVAQQRDTGAFYYPLTEWFVRELLAGRFPLWCPLIFAGYPIVADGEIGMLYPPNLLALLLLPTDVAFVVVRGGHYLLAAAGVYVLGRVLGLGRGVSVYGGVAFALGGFMVGHLDHGNIVRTAAWLPIILCCAELGLRADDRRRYVWLELGAASVTLAGLGLHPQILLIDLVALGTYIAARTLEAVEWRDGWRRSCWHVLRMSGRAAVVVAVIALLGVAGAAIQLFPMYELGKESSRGAGLTYAQAAAGGLHPVDFLTLLLPYGFRADPAVQWMRYPYWETTVYVGLVGLVLAVLGLVCGRRRVTVPIAAVGAVGLLLAMADHALVNLYAWLWPLPGFSSMRAPVRYTLMVELALAVLAAVGLEHLRSATRAARGRLAAAGLVWCLIAALIGGWWAWYWLATDPTGSLAAIQDSYLSLPHDRPTLAATAVRTGLLGTLDVQNRWTALAIVSGLGTATVLLLWVWRGHGWLAGSLAALGVAELLLVAHSFHPIVTMNALKEASRPLRFLSSQPDGGRVFLAGGTDVAITSRPALVGVAQVYGYSSLPSSRMERYWTRVNSTDDALIDLWGVRYVVESKAAQQRPVYEGVHLDPAHPLLSGRAGGPLGFESFRVASTQADTVRLFAALNHSGSVPDGEIVAEITVTGADEPPITLAVRAGDQVSEAVYDHATSPLAHQKARVGLHWEPRDPTGRVYPRDIYLADLPLPSLRAVEQIDVRTTLPEGSLYVVGMGLLDTQSNVARSILPPHRAKYRTMYEDDATIIQENRAALPRAFLVPRAVAVPEDEWALAHLTDGTLDLRQTVLVERVADRANAPWRVLDGPPLDAGERAEIVDAVGGAVTIRVWANAERYLVLTDSYFPGWQATIDGRPVSVERADYLFRAVLVPPGEHTVAWHYWPSGLTAGATMTLVAVAALPILLAYGLGGRLGVVRVGRRPAGRDVAPGCSAGGARRPRSSPSPAS
jgi:hypothetical protein